MTNYEKAYQRYCIAYDVVHPGPLYHDPEICPTKASLDELAELEAATKAFNDARWVNGVHYTVNDIRN